MKKINAVTTYYVYVQSDSTFSRNNVNGTITITKTTA